MSMNPKMIWTIGGVVAMAGMMASVPPAQAAPSDWVDDAVGGAAWRSLSPGEKQAVCNAYLNGGKPAIRQVVRLTNKSRQRINWDHQKAFQRVAVTKCSSS